jgi:hypothetical protein
MLTPNYGDSRIYHFFLSTNLTCQLTPLVLYSDIRLYHLHRADYIIEIWQTIFKVHKETLRTAKSSKFPPCPTQCKQPTNAT